ncbi:hypothetical protein ACJX0J_042463 [Zea mays]
MQFTILPENMGYILSHPETKDRVQSWFTPSLDAIYQMLLLKNLTVVLVLIEMCNHGLMLLICHLSDAIIERILYFVKGLNLTVVLVLIEMICRLPNFIFYILIFILRNLTGPALLRIHPQELFKNFPDCQSGLVIAAVIGLLAVALFLYRLSLDLILDKINWYLCYPITHS